jgi:hypothetical protein
MCVCMAVIIFMLVAISPREYDDGNIIAQTQLMCQHINSAFLQQILLGASVVLMRK